MPAVTLRYFAVIGRAQPLRHALYDAGVAFEDVRVPLEEWPRHRGDRSFGGPFGSLPTLTWDGVTIGEMLAIAAFLARRLGHYEGRDDTAIAALEAVCSNCAIEIAVPIAEVIYSDLMAPGTDFAAAVGWRLARIVQKADALEANAPASGWFGGARPVMADFYAAEALEVLRMALGPARTAAIDARWPRLAARASQMRARPSLAPAWAERPSGFTVKPDEPAMLEQVAAFDLSAVGL